ncbi:sporulation protein [Rheinheimera texasensis]|uniref:sporulation protein n=1 Tax=Rheinheimera texasensis TaxID=306205 RepID=UPI0032B1B32C
MLKQLLASAGIGACKIDTQLQSNQCEPGGCLKGQILIQGGAVAQQINGFSLALMTRVKVSTDNGEHYQNFCLQRFRLSDAMQVAPGSQQQIPFELRLSAELPVTHLPHHTVGKVWLCTEADITMALDPSDNDLLRIDASPLVLNSISAMLELGYQLQKVDVEKGYLQVPGKRSQSGCYQEFEFRPRQWLSGVKEVELSFIPDGADTLLLVEVDRAFRGDSYRTVRLSPQTSSAQIQQALRGILG